MGAGSKAEGSEASEAGDSAEATGSRDAGDAEAEPFPLQYGPSASPVSLTLRCPQCDTPIDDADVFCGECGFVLKAVVPGPRDTVAVEPVELGTADAGREPVPASDPEPAPDPDREPAAESDLDEPGPAEQVDAEPGSPAARVFAVNAAMISFGWLMELLNPPHRARTRWLPFVLGCIVGAVAWIAIAVQIGVSAERGHAPPMFVYVIFVSLFVLFNSFAVNQALQYKRVGRWRDYRYGERWYLWLSLVAKSLLAWQVFANVLVL